MAEEQKPIVFTRRSSGLVRSVSVFSAFALVMCHTVGGGINKLMIFAEYNNPGANVALAFFITGILALVTAYVYSELSALMPRTGGDYIFISRGISPLLGFITSWGFWFTEVLSFGIIAFYDIPVWGLGFQIAGAATKNTALLDLGTKISQIGPTFWLGMLMVAIFGVVALFGMRKYTTMINILLILPLVGSIIMIIVLLKSPAVAHPSWDATWGAGMWDTVVRLSKQATDHWVQTPFNMTATLMAGVGGLWAYIGVTSASYAGGEVKNPERNMSIAMLGGAAVIVFYYVVLSIEVYRMYATPDGSFISMYCNVFQHKDLWGQLTAIYPHAPNPYLPVFAAALMPGQYIFQFIVAISAAIWLMNDIPVFLIVCSRQIFSWSFDRMFPERFAAVNERWHTPHNAIWLTTIGGFIGVILSFVSERGIAGAWVAAMDTTMLYEFAVVFGSLAAVVLPFVRPDIYERGRRLSWFGVPVITIFGIISFFANFWYLFIAGTWLKATTDLMLQVIWMAAGVAIFVGYYIYNTKKGVDVRSIYQQIPPA
ncbi:MAG: APC family permease [Caldiserica bacterium]|nr:APC family permease [Caldisericota bacterium]